MQSRALEILVGFFVCLGMAAIFILTFRVASLDQVGKNGQAYRVSATFENVGGLTAGASVKLAGVRIGRVKDIVIDPTSFEAKATLEIDATYNTIPKDTNAKILTAGLLGEQYIGLEVGGDEASLKDGDEIKLTQSAFVLENIIGRFLTSATESSGKQEAPESNSKE